MICKKWNCDEWNTYVIAEIGNNHQGSLENALNMIKVAKEYCNVDAVKFQKRDNKVLFTKEFYEEPYLGKNSFGATYGEHREALELGKNDFIEIRDYCQSIGVDLLVTPFDIQSVDLLEDIGIHYYKIASSDIDNIPLIEYIAERAEALFVSTGCSSLEDIDCALETIMKYQEKVALLHCICKYPPDINECNLNSINVLKDRYNNVVLGYSGHELGNETSLIAHAMGAKIIERHFTLDKNLPGSDHKISLNPEEMKQLVDSLAIVDSMLGKYEKIKYDYEKAAKRKLGKGLYANNNIAMGSVITIDDIAIKSPTACIAPVEIKKVVGRKAASDICKGEPVKWEDIE